MKRALFIFIFSVLLGITGSFLIGDMRILPEVLLGIGVAGYIYSVVLFVKHSGDNYRKPLGILLASIVLGNFSGLAERYINFAASITLVVISGIGIIYAIVLFVKLPKKQKA